MRAIRELSSMARGILEAVSGRRKVGRRSTSTRGRQECQPHRRRREFREEAIMFECGTAERRVLLERVSEGAIARGDSVDFRKGVDTDADCCGGEAIGGE